MWHECFTVLISLIFLTAAPPARAESVSALLEKAIYSEETAGNLDEAIKLYKQIVAEAKANRPAVAQAMFRLGACQMKKGQTADAVATLNALIAHYPDQKELVAKALKQIQASRQNMGEAEIAKVVKEAVTTISTCAEGNPKVATALASLQGLNETATAKALVKYLDSDEPAVRRSAIYVLWNGPFESIEPAVPALMKLCSHPEEFTRGMAALALGAKKVASSYQTLCDMATADKSGYARRCAAIALGWLGRPEAKEVLERVLKDKDTLVRANAQAAMGILTAPKPQVISTTPAAFADDVDPSLNKITVTFDQEMRVHGWFWNGEKDTSPTLVGVPSYDAQKTTCTLHVELRPGKVYWVGVNTPGFMSFESTTGVRAAPYAILFATKSADGKATPIPAELLAKAKAINAAATTRAPRAPTAADKRASEKVAAQAWRLWRERKFAAAEPLFQQAVEKDPTNADAWNGLGWSQFNLGEALNAQASFEKCVALKPKHAGALNGLGWTAKIGGKTDEAIEYWRKALQADPAATAAMNGLTTTFMELKRYDEAAKAYQMWLKVEPKNSDARVGLEKAKAAMKEGH